MAFPTNSVLREASTGLLLARTLAPHASLFARAAETEELLNRYHGRAFGLRVSEAMADEVLDEVGTKAEELRRGFAEITLADVADEAWRCLLRHSCGRRYLPFRPYSEGLLRDDSTKG